MNGDKIKLKGLRQNNLKNIDLEIPKGKIVVFTGVSGSGKSSIVFDTIAVESTRQMNETYPAFVRSRLPHHPRPDFDSIENLSPSVIIDQSPLGRNSRSTVGTASEIYSGLRLLFSRVGKPYAGTASFFSFNDPVGMCPECSGLGMVADIEIDRILDKSKSLNEGAITDSMLKVGSWYWRQYVNCGLFDADKLLKDYSEKEMDALLYGIGDGSKIAGIYNLYRRRYLDREVPESMGEKSDSLIVRRDCPLCHGKRLNRIALSCWINGYSIADLCDMELTDLRKVLLKIKEPAVDSLVEGMVRSLTRMIDIGLGYLSLSRSTDTLSGGEAQRVKLVRFLGSSLTDMMYIFDEPSSGMHPRDVHRMNKLLIQLRDKGNTVIVVEHDEDVISIADEVVDIGPLAGTGGGSVVFQGSYGELLESGTLTGDSLRRKTRISDEFRVPTSFLPIRDANLNNLKSCDADIPLGCICTITGVAGSGKSSLMKVFMGEYGNKAVWVDQKPITATVRSTPASYLGFMDPIRKAFASANGVDAGMFSYNSAGACPCCKGKGIIVTELAFMDPIETVCEECGGTRFSKEALSYKYNGMSIVDVMSLTADRASEIFKDRVIGKKIDSMRRVGLSYLTIGQPMSTLSGGERQRIKLASQIDKKGMIYILDEPTTGLHPSDIDKLMILFNGIVDSGGSVILIEHNLEVMKMSDYIIDVGPDGGKDGGEIVFAGTPRKMIESSDTITAKCLRKSDDGERFTNEELDSMISVKQDEEEEEMGSMRLNPIGRIENNEGKFKAVLDERYRKALKGLEGFSHIQVVWWFDGCDNEKDRSVLVNTKPYAKGPEEMGTFATRSPSRPNPIAITVAEVSDIDFEKGIIELSYIDAMNGTPILDIKPYTPSLDKVDDAKVPEWCSHWPKSYDESGDFDWDSELNHPDHR